MIPGRWARAEARWAAFCRWAGWRRVWLAVSLAVWLLLWFGVGMDSAQKTGRPLLSLAMCLGFGIATGALAVWLQISAAARAVLDRLAQTIGVLLIVPVVVLIGGLLLLGLLGVGAKVLVAVVTTLARAW